MEVTVLNEGNGRKALFVGIFVGIVVLLVEYLIPNTSIITIVIITGISVLLGGWIGSKLFQKNCEELQLNQGVLTQEEGLMPFCVEFLIVEKGQVSFIRLINPPNTLSGF